jgi:hypothetical protein
LIDFGTSVTNQNYLHKEVQRAESILGIPATFSSESFDVPFTYVES